MAPTLSDVVDVSTGSSTRIGLWLWSLLGEVGPRLKHWQCFAISILQMTTMSLWWNMIEMIQRGPSFKYWLPVLAFCPQLKFLLSSVTFSTILCFKICPYSWCLYKYNLILSLIFWNYIPTPHLGSVYIMTHWKNCHNQIPTIQQLLFTTKITLYNSDSKVGDWS